MEKDPLLPASNSSDNFAYHNEDIEKVFAMLSTSRNGLTNNDAKEIRTKVGGNDIPPPVDYPAWLCCLLPCLLRTESMLKYHEAVPEQGTILRNGRWLSMDSHSIVPGDVIKVERGMRVPADMRIFEADQQCTFDTRMVSTRQSIKQVNLSAPADSNYELSSRMAFLGYLCVEGSCKGVVVSTGDKTLLGTQIKRGAWSPK